MGSISIVDAVRFAFRFVSERWLAILRLATVPLILMWTTLYLSFGGYIDQLLNLLHSHNDRTASLILGLTSGGFMLSLFLHSSYLISITELLMKPEKRVPWLHFYLGRSAWRLFAAYLRILLLFAIWVLAVKGLRSVNVELKLFSGAIPSDLAILAIGIFSLLLMARVAFTMPPIVVAERGAILRRSWALTANNTLRVAVLMLLTFLPALAVLYAGNAVLVATGIFPALPAALSLATAATTLKSVLHFYVALFVLAYFAASTFSAAAAVAVYRALADTAPAKAPSVAI